MYFKILREDLTHHGFIYHEGLNVDPNSFDPTSDCEDGLFFADEKHILEYCNYGTKIAEVTVPDGYMLVRSVNEAKELIRSVDNNMIELVDCDHDLGDYASDGGDGIKLLDWLVET